MFNFKKLIIYISLILTFFGINFSFAEKDLLEKAFTPSYDFYGTMVWWETIWTSKWEVWRYVLKDSLSFSLSVDKHWVSGEFTRQWSMIVSAMRLFLRVMLMLALTLIIYNWIMYVIKSSNWEETKDIFKRIIYISVWILLALLSVVIVRIVYSIWTTTINPVYLW